MLDLNDSPTQRAPVDLDALSAALGQCADEWVPAYFKNGVTDGDVLRLASINGDRPHKKGSCVITLVGPGAGSYFDHDPAVNSGGGPLSTLQHATDLSGQALLQKATELTKGLVSSAPERRTTREVSTPKVIDPTVEINHILEHAAEPAPDSRVGVYLKSRGLTIPDCPDLLYHSNLTDYKAPGGPVGRPAMVAVVRNAAGERIGLHRTFLAYDGTAKADMPSPRKMLGAVEGGVVRLCAAAPVLGIAEGIETALAVTALFGVPCWAALSARNLSVFAPPAGVTKLLIFADAGKAGEDAARVLKNTCGLPCDVILPRGGDDFNADASANLWKGEPYVVAADVAGDLGNSGADRGPVPGGEQPAAEIEAETLATYAGMQNGSGTEVEAGQAPAPVLSPADLAALIATLGADTPSDRLNTALRLIVAAHLPKPALEDTLKAIRLRTGRSVKSLREALQIQGREGAPDWISAMICYENGEPKPILENLSRALEKAPEWLGVLALDEFSQTIIARRPPPWVKANGHWDDRPWTDTDDLEATRWAQSSGVHVRTDLVHDAVRLEAARNGFHPVRDFLRELHWDGTPRLDRWLTFYCGVDITPYSSAVGAKFLISAVARVMEPGAKTDAMLIMEGKQGIGKSTAFEILFRPWFTDQLSEITTKDASGDLAGKWCVEFADLHRFSRADKNALKSFLSRRLDHYRPPYARHAIDAPRQCVFVGTSNEDVYIDDPTGARRLWPVRCTSVDLESIARDREQLWAEAATRYAAGERLYLTDDELRHDAEEQQEARQIDDALTRPIHDLLAGRLDPTVSIAEVLGSMGTPKDRWDRGMQTRIGHALRKLGWLRYRESGGKREWRYRRS
jgi:hypothetical protein